MLCSELWCSPDKPYLTPKGEVLLCCCIFEEQHLQYKMPRISDNSPKDPSLPNLDIVIRNRSVFPSCFSQKNGCGTVMKPMLLLPCKSLQS